jgi:hypothetical protein
MLATLTIGAGAVRHGHRDSRLRINGLRPRDLGDRSFTAVSPVPIASSS